MRPRTKTPKRAAKTDVIGPDPDVGTDLDGVPTGEEVEGRDHVVFGLGNPGAKYRRTRHNLGFMLLDHLDGELGRTPKAGRGDYVLSDGELEGRRLLLVRPTTYMNLSGRAVAQVLANENLEAPKWMVAVDDVAIDLGKLRMRPSGSHAGHNGLRSIHEVQGNGDYPRLRLGCGPAPEDEDLADFVLGEFLEDEWDAVGKMVGRAAHAVRGWLVDGVERTMSRFNG